jgi:hypothetical protein
MNYDLQRIRFNTDRELSLDMIKFDEVGVGERDTDDRNKFKLCSKCIATKYCTTKKETYRVLANYFMA